MDIFLKAYLVMYTVLGSFFSFFNFLHNLQLCRGG